MSWYEAGLLLEAYNDHYKEYWELQRWLAYITAASNGAKVKTPKDLLKFNWELTEPVDTRTPEQIKSSQQRMIKKMQNKSIYKK